MTRLKALVKIDPETKKRSYKEYVIYEEWWYGVDFLGRKIAPVTNTEGVWQEQEIKPEFDEETNKRIIGYEYAGQHPVYTIPFSKSAVDKIFKEYGIEDKDAVRYIVKFDGPGVPYNSRSYKWTYEQFSSLSYEDLKRRQFRTGGVIDYTKPESGNEISAIR